MNTEKCKQHFEYDCFLACITALVDGDYEKLWHDMPEYDPRVDSRSFIQRMDKDRGILGANVDAAFERAGLSKNKDYWCASFVGDMTISSNVRQLLKGRRAILQVPSLNYENGMHIVLWDGETLHDPSPKQKYQWLNHSLQIHYAWVFNEIRSERKST